MADPYVYENTNILKNKMNLKDEQTLIDVEAQFIIANMLDIHTLMGCIDFTLPKSIQQIHQFLFQSIYPWAGEFRTINIYKAEQVLHGLSISYSDKDKIEKDLTVLFKSVASIQWEVENTDLVENFAACMTELWRIHPFREGNTRMTTIFMTLLAEKMGLPFNQVLLAKHIGYLRNALVMAAVDEKPEPQYLQKMLKDALFLSS